MESTKGQTKTEFRYAFLKNSDCFEKVSSTYV